MTANTISTQIHHYEPCQYNIGSQRLKREMSKAGISGSILFLIKYYWSNGSSYHGWIRPSMQFNYMSWTDVAGMSPSWTSLGPVTSEAYSLFKSLWPMQSNVWYSSNLEDNASKPLTSAVYCVSSFLSQDKTISFILISTKCGHQQRMNHKDLVVQFGYSQKFRGFQSLPDLIQTSPDCRLDGSLLKTVCLVILQYFLVSFRSAEFWHFRFQFWLKQRSAEAWEITLQ